METFSALLAICAGNSPVPGEFPAQRPVTRSFDVFFDLRLNKRLSKQSRGWWFETPSRSLWCQRNGLLCDGSWNYLYLSGLLWANVLHESTWRISAARFRVYIFRPLCTLTALLPNRPRHFATMKNNLTIAQLRDNSGSYDNTRYCFVIVRGALPYVVPHHVVVGILHRAAE